MNWRKKGVQIISNSVTISLDAGGGHAKGVLTLNGPIGKRCLFRSADGMEHGRVLRWRIMRQDEYY